VEGEVNVAMDAVAVGFNLLGESRLADSSAANIKWPYPVFLIRIRILIGSGSRQAKMVSQVPIMRRIEKIFIYWRNIFIY
jgi:hypothetical protein